jgi:hypothetical protein
MPIIIFGVRGIESNVDSGEFYCPRCDAQEEYDRKQSRPFFTVFFIPLFPVGGASRFIQCRGCGQMFSEDVLNFKPPSEAQRMLGQFYQELKTGTSIEVVRQKMLNHDMTAEEADRALEKMCEGHPKACRCGQHFHPRVFRCTSCGAEL